MFPADALNALVKKWTQTPAQESEAVAIAVKSDAVVRSVIKSNPTPKDGPFESRLRAAFREEIAKIKTHNPSPEDEPVSPPPEIQDNDDDNFLDNLSTPQKVVLGASAIALQWWFTRTPVAPVQVAIPKAPSSLLSRIGLTPTNVAIVAVAAVAYNVLKPKVETLTSAYTTWKPRIDAAKSLFNWFNA
jgi:hypothetical protein